MLRTQALFFWTRLKIKYTIMLFQLTEKRIHTTNSGKTNTFQEKFIQA